jgi:hypothetical protein
MRKLWEAIREGLVRTLSSLQAEEAFQSMRCWNEDLANYEDLGGLIDFITTLSADRDEKNQVYAALVREVKGRGAGGKVAQAVIWVGLWPGLDHVFRRRVRHFRGAEDELVSGICDAFTGLVATMDLTRVRRIAATLIRSTDRVLMEGRHQRWREEKWLRRVALVAEGRLAAEDWDWTGMSYEGELRWLRDRLLPIVGPDVDLLLRVDVLGENQHEAAEAMGLTHEAGRKRVQKARRRAQAFFTGGCPSSPAKPACGGGNGQR